MMNRLVFPLERHFQRPVIKLGEYGGLMALIVTGARFPVWTSSHRLIEKIGGRNQGIKVKFGGFGGQTTGDLYRIDLKVGKIIYDNMPIVVEDNPPQRPFQIVLSAANLDGLVYHIDMINRNMWTELSDEELIRRLDIKREPGENGMVYSVELI